MTIAMTYSVSANAVPDRKMEDSIETRSVLTFHCQKLATQVRGILQI
jgi:hypothetical protein